MQRTGGMCLAILLLSLLLNPRNVTVASAEEGSLLPSGRAFHIGEQLTYTITWLNIRAGTAVMGVTAEGNRALKLVTTAESRPAITKFFPVDNRLETWVDPETLLPQHLTFHRREGKKKEDIEYIFQQKRGTVTEVKGGAIDTFPLLPHTHDAISCLYYARNELRPHPGSAVTMNVHHDKKNHTLKAVVETIETITGPWGSKETIRVLVVMPSEGIFRNKGHIQVWFTNDARRIPLRMKARVVIGTIVADLTPE
jgi:Protein of unknown function (DUF3108)